MIEDGALTKYVGKGGDVVIPDGVSSIGAYAFYNCTSLTSITIPGSAVSVEYSAFRGCTSIKVTYRGKAYNYDNINELYSESGYHRL